MVFITNNFDLTALEVALHYKHRWFIEIFFNWIKQHLKIKSFWGRSDNDVKNQILIAVAVYIIVLVVRKKIKTSAFDLRNSTDLKHKCI